MEPLPSGGFLTVSTTQSFGSPHIGLYDGSLWLLNINRNGTVNSSYLITPPVPSIYYDSTLLPDNSVVVVGTTWNYHNAVITKIFLNGTVAFYLEISPSTNSYAPHLTSVVYDSNFIYAVGAFFDISLYRPIQWILKIDLEGNIVESIGFDPGSPFYYPTPFSVKVSNSTLYFAGYGYTSPSIIMAFDIHTWTTVFAYMVGNSSGDNIYGMTLANDKVIVVGSTDDYDNESAFIAMIDSNGSLLWGKAFGSTGTTRYFGVYYDNKYAYVTGWSQTNYASYRNDTLVAKLDANSGNIEWYRIIGGVEDDWAYRIYVDNFGYIHVIGGIGASYDRNNIMILKLSSNGTIPNCELLRDDTLNIYDYTPSVSSFFPQFYNYTSTTYSILYMVSVSNETPLIYKLCSCIIGGNILSSELQQEKLEVHAVTPLIITSFILIMLKLSNRK